MQQFELSRSTDRKAALTDQPLKRLSTAHCECRESEGTLTSCACCTSVAECSRTLSTTAMAAARRDVDCDLHATSSGYISACTQMHYFFTQQMISEPFDRCTQAPQPSTSADDVQLLAD